MKQLLSFLVIFLFGSLSIFSQTNDSDKIIQFSGVVVTQDELGELIPLPYTTIAIAGTSRGTYAEVDGFFSIVAEKGDTVVFSRIGFKTIKQVISDSLDSKFYSWYQIMSYDDVLLPEAVIYPWPSRDHYKLEFLALDVTNELRQRAEENLAAEILERMKSEVALDGTNAYEITKQRQAIAYQYAGQYKPQKIFDVMAWGQFIKAWKRGDFKKKKKKKKSSN